MTNTFTFKLQSFYVAYAPDTGACSYGGCGEEAVGLNCRANFPSFA